MSLLPPHHGARMVPKVPVQTRPARPPQPCPSPSSTAKPILQSMAGNSIQAVTKDEWGPPAGGSTG